MPEVYLVAWFRTNTTVLHMGTLSRLLHNRTLIYWLVFVVAAFLGTKRIIKESGDIGIYLQAAQELFEGHGDLYRKQQDQGSFAYPLEYLVFESTAAVKRGEAILGGAELVHHLPVRVAMVIQQLAQRLEITTVHVVSSHARVSGESDRRGHGATDDIAQNTAPRRATSSAICSM